ncbi:MAG: group II intron maturase-specific domain-containing protein [Eubacteriales bacterium]|nr:group II intron maturase-specific domain-containing protein [Eubacteriales bacterium]
MHFGLELEESKSRIIEFGRHADERCRKNGEKPGTFTFLGFTHYCSKSRNGKFRVKRKTSKKKFAKKCKEVHREIAEMRILSLPQIIKKLNQMLVGYYHYYGITDNFKGIDNFCLCVRRSLFYWINRRSQKKSYTWEGFNAMMKDYPLARPKIYVSIYG